MAQKAPTVVDQFWTTKKHPVSGKQLHNLASVRCDFWYWIEDRTKRCNLIEGRDWKRASIKLGRLGRPEQDIILTADAAAVLATAERGVAMERMKEVKEKLEVATEKGHSLTTRTRLIINGLRALRATNAMDRPALAIA